MEDDDVEPNDKGIDKKSGKRRKAITTVLNQVVAKARRKGDKSVKLDGLTNATDHLMRAAQYMFRAIDPWMSITYIIGVEQAIAKNFEVHVSCDEDLLEKDIDRIEAAAKELQRYCPFLTDFLIVANKYKCYKEYNTLLKVMDEELVGTRSMDLHHCSEQVASWLSENPFQDRLMTQLLATSKENCGLHSFDITRLIAPVEFFADMFFGTKAEIENAVEHMQMKKIPLSSDDFLCYMYPAEKQENLADPEDTEPGLLEGYLPMCIAKCSLTRIKSVLVTPAKPRKNCIVQILKLVKFTTPMIAYYQVLTYLAISTIVGWEDHDGSLDL
ncbi:hypothetical protein VNI00_017317 [Paramarasmius palmivorus]|uniref:Uncharacterized protein n=1 Tax=Paramarasmius palmivorus TaxID=297713 RepID=A0AAW0B8C4_9AGAR